MESEMPEQATQALDAISEDDVADFLLEQPDADSLQEEVADDPENEGEESLEIPDDDAPDEDDSDEEEAKPTREVKFKVPVKGEDGQDTTVEVDQKELIAGYQRQADYTRKTQELSKRESEAYEVVKNKLDEGSTHILQEVHRARGLIERLAGLKSPDEMAVLARSDPAAWVAERDREQTIQRARQELDAVEQQTQQKLEQQRAEQYQRAVSNAWAELGKEGIDNAKLEAIYKEASKRYRIPMAKLATIVDPALVKVLRDGTAYQQLKDKKAVVTQKVSKAPPLPAQRQRVPQDEQVAKRRDQKFRNGTAKLTDLAGFLASNKL